MTPECGPEVFERTTEMIPEQPVTYTEETDGMHRENPEESRTVEVDKLSLLDPYSLMPQSDWRSCIKAMVESFLPDGRLLCGTAYIAPAVVVIVVISATVLDIVGSASATATERWVIALRTIFTLYALPFLVCSNVSIIFLKRSVMNTENRRMVKRMLWICMILVLIFFVLLIVFSLVINFGFKPFVLKELTPVPDSYVSRTISKSAQAAFCRNVIENWTVVELAGLAAMAQSYGHRNAQEAILSAFTDNLTVFEDIPMPEALASPMIIAVKDKSLAFRKLGRFDSLTNNESNLIAASFAFQGVREKGQVGILLENILAYWYPKVMGFVVPLFQTVNDLFLGNFLNALSTTLAVLATGLRQITIKSLKEVVDPVSQVLYLLSLAGWDGNSTVFTGHMPGGTVAKTLAAANKFSGVAFECPVLANSPAAVYASTIDNVAAGFRLVNVFSDDSLFSASEANISMNVHVPKYQSYFKPANPYETFCMVNAACATDDRADLLCKRVVGAETYMLFFRQLGRERLSIFAES
jgi:hypothetical protein